MTRRSRRVLLVHQPTDGGVGRHVADLAAGLARMDYEVILCGPELPARAPRSQPLSQLALQRSIAPAADLLALRRFAGIVRDVRPDLIHAHSSKAGSLARLGRILYPRVPVMYTPHGYAFAGYFAHRAQRSAYRQIERALAPLATRTVCVCEAEARLARSIGRADRVRMVHNGIEPAGDGPVEARMARLAEAGPVICALTLLRPGKGLETLIDALPSVLERHPRVQLAIGGKGPEAKALSARALACGAGEAVHFIGQISDPYSVLRGATVFAHPSLAESFPYVILEAMSSGLAIVANDVGGIGEAIVDGESGLLVEPGDARALAAKLLELLDDDERRSRIGLAARRRVERLFTLGAMTEGLAAVYEEVLDAHPPSAGDRRHQAPLAASQP